jgi:hypothetical protein
MGDTVIVEDEDDKPKRPDLVVVEKEKPKQPEKRVVEKTTVRETTIGDRD